MISNDRKNDQNEKVDTLKNAYDYQNRLPAGNSETLDKDSMKSQKTAIYAYDLLGRIKKETKTGSEDISYTYSSNFK